MGKLLELTELVMIISYINVSFTIYTLDLN